MDPSARGLSIQTSGLDDGLMVMADAVRFEQVVMNLLSNAVKFTPQGGSIVIKAGAKDGTMRLDVIDSGQGIDQGSLEKVFDMYGQANSVTTRAKGGLGIGLALVRELVQLHGGRIEVRSEGIGKGTCFSVWMPLVERAQHHDQGRTADVHRDIAGLRILLVDDIEDAVLVMKSLLDMYGADVTAATSARQALDLLGHQEFDLLVSDISMPDMDGYALLREVRRMPRYATLPAVAVTGLAREQDIAAACEAGFSAHLGKPLSMDRLLDIIPGLLRRRSA
jgi:two-component system CheB/CheR fusion protein